MKLALIPCTLKAAALLVQRLHRHHAAPIGGLFAVACAIGPDVCGVAIVGRPVARANQDGYTAEVTRLATDGTKNACSLLYGACWRAARALGYRRLITYTLASESGTSLRAAGWRNAGIVKGRTWSRPSRPRLDAAPLSDKVRWVAGAAACS